MDISDIEIEAYNEKPNNVPPSVGPRDSIPTWQWILILVGLYLGALLYGMHSFAVARLVTSSADIRIKVWIPQFPLTFKPKCTKTWDISRTYRGLASDSQWHQLQSS